jgi:hypothetical protein
MPGENDLDSGSFPVATPHPQDVRGENGIHLTPLKKMASLGPRCRFCPGREFRRSRFRPRDSVHLLLLRYPVRCLRCRQRQMISVFAAARAESSKVRIERTPEPADTWRNWTIDRRPEFVAVPPPVRAPADAPVQPLQQRPQSIPVASQPTPPTQPSRISIVAPRRDNDENAIW